MFKRLGITGRLSIDEYLQLTREESLSENVELFLMGRAADQLKDLYPSYPPDQFFNAPCQPAIIRSWHNHFDNYGNFMPGYCGGISLGSWFELDRLLKEGIELETHPVLKYLANEDIKGLLNFSIDRGYSEVEEGYVSKCHLCLDIRRYLALSGDFEELKPRQFYEQLK
jgi:hypothetical protein